MYAFGNSHDSCIREAHIATGHSVGEDLSMTIGWETTVCAGWLPDSSGDYTGIAANRVYWRDASEWMGDSLRYREEPRA
jgi:hypothetical protein